MTVSFEILHIRAPKVEFKRDEEFEIQVDVEGTGSGSSRLYFALYDKHLGKYIGAWATVDPLSPNKYTCLISFNPLDGWYPSPIPGIFPWKVEVGYMEDDTGAITDSEDFKMPRVVDRICNGYFCVGVSNPYPAPGEEIMISGHQQIYKYGCGKGENTLALVTDETVLMYGDPRGDYSRCGEGSDCACYFCLPFKAPRFEGGYTYWVWSTGIPGMVSDPIGIWVTTPPKICEDFMTRVECEAAACYWYDNACHSEPPPPPPSWWEMHKGELILLGTIGAAMVGVMILGRRGRKV